MRWKLKKGMGIVEVIIGAGVAAVGLIAVIQLATRAVSNSGVSGRASQAGKYAAEGLAWVKGNSWSFLNIHIGSYCINTLGWSSSGGCGGGGYYRNRIFAGGGVGTGNGCIETNSVCESKGVLE